MFAWHRNRLGGSIVGRRIQQVKHLFARPVAAPTVPTPWTNGNGSNGSKASRSLDLVEGRRLTSEERRQIARSHADHPTVRKALQESRAEFGQPLEASQVSGVSTQVQRDGPKRD